MEEGRGDQAVVPSAAAAAPATGAAAAPFSVLGASFRLNLQWTRLRATLVLQRLTMSYTELIVKDECEVIKNRNKEMELD